MYDSLEKICQQCEKTGKSFFKVVCHQDCNEEDLSEAQVIERMHKMYDEMRRSNASYDAKRRSTSGLIGGEAGLLRQRIEANQMISGDFISCVMEKALRVASNNACMRRIVAAPTAGACGVLPAVLLTYQEKYETEDEDMVKALFVAAGIGGVIAQRASLSGAQDGCQAEIGSASAMAAGALAYLEGGDNETICHACALALKNLLGLACDPVGGLVEIPCVKRNVIGAVNAVTSADLALAGIRSKIPADQVIDTMRSIGQHMSSDIKETGIGGLASTPAAKAWLKKQKNEYKSH
ncbi:L-serine ammonia-lyase, iron-sulfur-dependent, subunit alpha [Catenisphaera adipataccumulans]|jgi:L-serine dehydratase|uniref:L-serine dehydratase n=1 Tax=Catenisphaera adipataccumulans TaxID=700500 RepID=A0A7W8D1M3_9FIRM|nr:L-serine ammonia-lyase, iron-sulfur-dependent, subunit alpha [Catenisphaera adipataccumulans]MBB5183905.1 L-serine dehydratase [Catenisphaera adipataccumulans]